MGQIDLGSSFRLTADLVPDFQPFEVVILSEPKRIAKEDSGFNSDSWDIEVSMPNEQHLTYGFGIMQLRKIMAAYTQEGSNWLSKKLRIQKVPQPKAKSGYSLYAEPIVPGQQALAPKPSNKDVEKFV